ncbi:hypothetical protein FOZ62_023275, partial [Perkinsus olseni]
MSSFGELIAALQSVRSVKDKRQAIRGWSKAIQPLLSSLDREAQIYAALAAANLTSFDISHDVLCEHGAIPELLQVAHDSDEPDLVVYGLLALGNLAGSPSTRSAMMNYKVLPAVYSIYTRLAKLGDAGTRKEEARVKVAALFALSNLSGCANHSEMMMNHLNVHEAVWKDLFDPSQRVMAQALE